MRAKKTLVPESFGSCGFDFHPYKTNSLTVEDGAESCITVTLPVGQPRQPQLPVGKNISNSQPF